MTTLVGFANADATLAGTAGVVAGGVVMLLAWTGIWTGDGAGVRAATASAGQGRT